MRGAIPKPYLASYGAGRPHVSSRAHVDRARRPVLPEDMAIASPMREWPLEDRPRERLYQKGAEALADAELLAIQLGTGVPGQTAVGVAWVILQPVLTMIALLQVAPLSSE